MPVRRCPPAPDRPSNRILASPHFCVHAARRPPPLWRAPRRSQSARIRTPSRLTRCAGKRYERAQITHARNDSHTNCGSGPHAPRGIDRLAPELLRARGDHNSTSSPRELHSPGTRTAPVTRWWRGITSAYEREADAAAQSSRRLLVARSRSQRGIPESSEPLTSIRGKLVTPKWPT